MEEEKLLALHASLSSLRKSAGLGVSSQYSWQNNATAPQASGVFVTSTKGETVRTDGLPVNRLYNNFLKEGTYDPKAKSAHGDGRAIKRDFSDCHLVSSEAEQDDESSSSSDNDEELRRKKKAQRKAEKKAAKKAAKLEAKKQAKLEEKRKAKELLKRKLAEEATETNAAADGDMEPPKKKSKKIKDDNKEEQKVETTKREKGKKDKKESKKKSKKEKK